MESSTSTAEIASSALTSRRLSQSLLPVAYDRTTTLMSRPRIESRASLPPKRPRDENPKDADGRGRTLCQCAQHVQSALSARASLLRSATCNCHLCLLRRPFRPAGVGQGCLRGEHQPHRCNASRRALYLAASVVNPEHWRTGAHAAAAQSVLRHCTLNGIPCPLPLPTLGGASDILHSKDRLLWLGETAWQVNRTSEHPFRLFFAG